MNQNKDHKKREAEAKKKLVEAAKAEISQLYGKVPASHSTWPYQKIIAFKACVANAGKVLHSHAATVERAQLAASELRSFFK